MHDVRPYPFDRWPRVPGREASGSRSWARASPLAGLVSGAREARWLGAPAILTPGVPKEARLDRDVDAAVLLEDASGARAVLCLDAAIASAIADRAVGGDGDGLEGAVGPLRGIELGLVAYAIARWLADGGSPFRVATSLTKREAIELAIGEQPHVRWPLEIAIGDARGHAALWLSAARAAPIGAPRAPSWIDRVSAEVIVRAGRAQLRARQIAALAPGDVIVLDDCWLDGARAGHAYARARGGRWTWRARIEAGVLRIESEGLDAEPTLAKETDVEDSDKVIEKLGDAPITLALELARFTMPLAELAALAPGEVLRTGRPIGERVALRAGDRTIAIGELVDVEGEVGVRVLELPGARGAGP